MFQKGQSGNPGGRPKKAVSVTNLLRELGEKVEIETDEGKKSRVEILVRKMWALALSGDATAIKHIYDRLEGTPTQTIHNMIQNLPDIVEIDLSGKSENQADTSTDTTLEE